MLKSDQGGEYESPFTNLCAHNGIIHETTTPYLPQSNRIVERKNRTLKEMMNAMGICFGLPQTYVCGGRGGGGDEVVLTVNFE